MKLISVTSRPDKTGSLIHWLFGRCIKDDFDLGPSIRVHRGPLKPTSLVDLSLGHVAHRGQIELVVAAASLRRVSCAGALNQDSAHVGGGDAEELRAILSSKPRNQQ